MSKNLFKSDPTNAEDEEILDKGSLLEGKSKINYSEPYEGWPNRLCAAIASQDVEGTRAALEAGVDPTCSKNRGASPLVLAWLTSHQLEADGQTELGSKAAEIFETIQEWIAQAGHLKRGGHKQDTNNRGARFAY